MSFAATWMDLKIIILSEVTWAVWQGLYAESKENDTNELIHKTETDPQTWSMNLWLPGVKCGSKEFGIDMYTLLYLK